MNKIKQEIIASAVGGIDTPGADALKQPYRFSADFIGFCGHFPGYPILPAFIQILTAVNLIEHHERRELKIATVEKAKFHKPIKPDHKIEVECRRQQAGNRAVWVTRINISGELASAFRVSFVQEEEGS